MVYSKSLSVLMLKMTFGFSCMNRKILALSNIQGISQMMYNKSHVATLCTSAQSDDDVLFDEQNNVGIITLNRPKALNSLNVSMVKKLYPKLLLWQNKDKKDLVIIQGAGEKSFCAGGDVVSITRNGPSKGAAIGREFFDTEYKVDHLIGHYKVPYVALIDGYTMGGGVGVSVHGKYRIATERTTFAMPETTIGLFPDVGGSYFLSRLKNNLGLYLALTSYQLKGKDVVKCGIGTHFINSTDLPKLVDSLIARPKDVDTILKTSAENLDNYNFSLDSNIKTIENAFGASTVEEIITRLEQINDEFANKTLTTLKKMSPISMKITQRQLKLGAQKNLTECLKMEYRLACSAVEAKSSTDFYEGVRALLIDKDKSPKWNPPTLEKVTSEMVDKCFEETADNNIDLSHE